MAFSALTESRFFVRSRHHLAVAWLAALCAWGSPAIGVTLYVDDDAPLGGDGFSWGTAFRFLLDAYYYSTNPDHGVTEIHVAQGVYQPDCWAMQPTGSNSPAWSFFVRNGLAIRGGYAGILAADPDARNIAAFETTLSGDLAGDDELGDSHFIDNSKHVLKVQNADSTAVLEGFTITGGNAGYEGGSEIYIQNGSAAIQSCVIRNTTALNYGSAIYIVAGNTQINDCQVVGNIADGLVVAAAAYPTLNYCVFTNHARTAITLGGAGIVIADCTFSNNVTAIRSYLEPSDDVALIEHSTFAEHSDTAVRISGYGRHRFVDCEFTANVGGVIYNSGKLTARRCAFHGNYSPESGGAVNNRGSCVFNECVFDGNYASNGGAVFNDIGAHFKAVNSTFRDNFAKDVGGAVCTPSFSYNPNSSAFINSLFFRNEAGASGGAIYSVHDTLTLTNCTLAHNAALLGGGICHDATATVRVRNSIIKNNHGGSFGGIGTRTVEYSNIAGGHLGLGNINLNPRFVNLSIGDLRLQPGSPCIDAGRNSSLPANVTIDADGLPRFRDDPATPDSGLGTPPIVDIGAYEFQPD